MLISCQQQEVLEENRRMIPDCGRRLVTAWDELSKLVVCWLSHFYINTSEHTALKIISGA